MGICSTCKFYKRGRDGETRCRWLFDFPKPFWAYDIVTYAPVVAEYEGENCTAYEQRDVQESYSQDATIIAILETTLREVEDDVCSYLCPSVWKTAQRRPPHSDKCNAIKRALYMLKPNGGPHV